MSDIEAELRSEIDRQRNMRGPQLIDKVKSQGLVFRNMKVCRGCATVTMYVISVDMPSAQEQ